MSIFTEAMICLYCVTNIIYIFCSAFPRDILHMKVNQQNILDLLKENSDDEP